LKRELIDEMLLCCQGLKLKNREEALQKALKFYKLLTINFPEGKIKRNVMLSSCIYISAGLLGERGITQANLARAFNISESILNKRYKELVTLLFPDAGKCCKTITSENKEQIKDDL